MRSSQMAGAANYARWLLGTNGRAILGTARIMQNQHVDTIYFFHLIEQPTEFTGFRGGVPVMACTSSSRRPW